MFIFSNKKPLLIPGEYTIFRKKGLRRLSLRVEPDGEIVVRAPIRVSERAIAQFVVEQELWIKKQKSHMNTLIPISHHELQNLKKLATSTLPDRVERLAKIHHFHYTSVTFRHQKTRWGSCSHKNRINLNIEIMRLPEYLQDYIILHELTHTLHKHHQKSFWDHLEKVLPGSLQMDREMKQWKIGYKTNNTE